MVRETKNGGRHGVKTAAKGDPAADATEYRPPFLSIQLPDRSWVALEMRPEILGVGRTRAEAEEAAHRRMRNPADDDAEDLEAIELHRHEKMAPLERLVKKYRR